MARADAGGGAVNVRSGLIALAAVAAFLVQANIVSAQTQPSPPAKVQTVPVTGQPSPSPEKVQATADQVIRQLDLQTEFPKQQKPWNIRLPPETLWVIIAVALGFLLYAFKDLIPFLNRHGAGVLAGEEEGAGDAAPRNPEVVLEAADELAAQGRFVEAMHVLLLQGLAEMRARLNEPFADSLTSREILRSASLPDNARAALRDVVHSVEWTYFGENPATREDYAACRVSFNALTSALHRSAAA
jgi:hypothetical protein